MSRPTRDTSRLPQHFAYGALTLFGRPFQERSAIYRNTTSKSHNPNPQADWFGLFRVRSPLLTESLLFSLPQGTEMFHFPWCYSEALFYSDSSDWAINSPSRVSPFGNLRIKACLPLPEAYRSLPRPSSPSSTKSSTIYPYYLNTITFLSMNVLYFPLTNTVVKELKRNR